MDVQSTLDEFLDLPDQQEDASQTTDMQDLSPVLNELRNHVDGHISTAVPLTHNDNSAAAAAGVETATAANVWAISNGNNSNMNNTENGTATPVAVPPMGGEASGGEQHPLYTPLSNTDRSATEVHASSLTTLLSASPVQEGHTAAFVLADAEAPLSVAPTLNTTPAEFIPPQVVQKSSGTSGVQEKQPKTPPKEEDMGRMRTRASSRRQMSTNKAIAAAEDPATTATAEVKRKKTKGKKLYCVCQKPYTGEPMIQCDGCKEWFHCACLNIDPAEAEDVDLWMCRSCEEKKNKDESPVVVPDQVPKEAKEANPPEQNHPPTPPGLLAEQQQQQEHVRKETRQTRSRKCLYPSCNNPTRADSYCSEVCVSKDALRKSNDSEYVPDSPPAPSSSLEQKHPKHSRNRASSISSTSTTATATATATTTSTKSQYTPPKETSPPPDDSIRKNVVKNMTTLLQTILQVARTRNPSLFDGEKKEGEEEKDDDATKAAELASAIEEQMFEQLAEEKKGNQHCGQQYKNKFRSLLYNLKDKGNQGFQLKVVTGELPPKDLVAMSAQDMANPELRSMSASMMQESIKNSVLKIETMPLIKKTHKGDIIMVDNENEYTAVPEEQEHGRQPEEEFQSITPTVDTPRSRQNSSVFSDGLDSRKSSMSLSTLTPVEAEAAAEQQQKEMNAFMAQLVGDAKDFDVVSPTKKRKLEDMLGGDDDDEYHLIPEDQDESPAPTTTTDSVTDDPKEGGSYTPPMYYQQPQPQQLPVVWHGRVNMPQVAEFNACARQIGGRTLKEHEWSEVLSPTMWIEGRIPMDRVASYVTQTQYSSSREIVLLEIAASTGGDQHPARALIDYFDSRKRYGVVGHNKTKIKDFYLIPLYKSAQLPDFSYVVRVKENQRHTDMFLGVLVLQKQRDSLLLPLPPQPTSVPAVPTMVNNHHSYSLPPPPSSTPAPAPAPYYPFNPSSSLYYY